MGDLDPDRTIFLDLRNKEELEVTGFISGTRHIPLNRLRESIPTLDREKNYVLFCAIGLRAYVGHRLLMQHGFRSKCLSGGYRTYLGGKKRVMEEYPDTKRRLGV